MSFLKPTFLLFGKYKRIVIPPSDLWRIIAIFYCVIVSSNINKTWHALAAYAHEAYWDYGRWNYLCVENSTQIWKGWVISYLEKIYFFIRTQLILYAWFEHMVHAMILSLLGLHRKISKLHGNFQSILDLW